MRPTRMLEIVGDAVPTSLDAGLAALLAAR
jgi:hypothetical protein